jgi:hypothetical protein
MGSLSAAASGTLGAQAIGAQVCLTFVRDGVVHTLLQRRSASVVTYAAARTVVPAFACEPLPQSDTLDPDWLWHNFLREYLEELHGIKELQGASAHVDPLWFLKTSQALQLRQFKDAGSLSFRLLGVTIDALNGEVNLACNCHVSDPHFWTTVVPDMVHNWEAAGLESSPLASPRLDDSLIADEFLPGAAVAIALTRRHLGV